jgi:hypothetical protein
MQLHASADSCCGCSCIHRCHITPNTTVPSLCCHERSILPFCTAMLSMLLMHLLLLALFITHPHTLGWPITAIFLPTMLLLLLPLVVITLLLLLLLLDPVPAPILATIWRCQSPILQVITLLWRCHCCQLTPRQVHQLHTRHTRHTRSSSSSIALRSSSSLQLLQLPKINHTQRQTLQALHASTSQLYHVACCICDRSIRCHVEMR